MQRLSRLLVAVLLVAAIAIFFARPAFAYGKDNWQLGFSGTGVIPGTGQGFGFWGWCAFGGGVTSGNDGDCQVAQYVHGPAGSGFTCHESIDVSAWDGSGGTFVIEAATVTVNPSSLTGPCLSFFPGPAGFPVDTGFPAAAGHYNFGGIGGVRGEFQVQVTQIPSK
jgi:hypothetical protein